MICVDSRCDTKMCDHHQLRQQPVGGEIADVDELSHNIGQLYMTDDYSDVSLIVGNTRLPAHKVILAARSEYFRALLFGGLRESHADCSEVELKDTNAHAFKYLLRYMYTAQMSLADMPEETILDVLGLAHKHGFTQLEMAISSYLKAVLTIGNVCLIYDIARLYSLQSLSQTCCEFMNRNATEIIHSDGFLGLSMNALCEVISWNALCATEIDIFEAVQRWVRHNDASPEHTAVIVSSLRLSLMKLDQLLNVVRPSGLLSPDAILDAIQFKNDSRDTQLNYRGFLVPEENIATLRYGTQVIRGEMKASLLDGDCQTYDLDKGFTRHPIDDNQGQGIVVKLSKPCIINTVKLLLWDKDMRSYSYYVEVSMDDKDWVRVIDHTEYLCRSWQYLRFADRVVRYVRVIGTHNTVNRVFHLVAFECMYSRQPVILDEGIIVPQENVATTKASACVVEGVSRSRNALINGDTNNYDWDSGYTCHQLGSGALLVELSQPYMLSSMRLLLWDCDGRSYSYYVAVSTDQQSWLVVADRSMVACKSWQTIVFPKQPVTSIKIVGTHNTANEVFHCVHFETPADLAALSSYTGDKKTSPPGKTTTTLIIAASSSTAAVTSSPMLSSSATITSCSLSVMSTAPASVSPSMPQAAVGGVMDELAAVTAVVMSTSVNSTPSLALSSSTTLTMSLAPSVARSDTTATTTCTTSVMCFNGARPRTSVNQNIVTHPSTSSCLSDDKTELDRRGGGDCSQ